MERVGFVCIDKHNSAHEELMKYSKKLGKEFGEKFSDLHGKVSNYARVESDMAFTIDEHFQKLLLKEVDEQTVMKLTEQLNVLEEDGFGFDSRKDNGKPALDLVKSLLNEFEVKLKSDVYGGKYVDHSHLNTMIAQLEKQLEALENFKDFCDNVYTSFRQLEEEYNQAKKMVDNGDVKHVKHVKDVDDDKRIKKLFNVCCILILYMLGKLTFKFYRISKAMRIRSERNIAS